MNRSHAQIAAAAALSKVLEIKQYNLSEDYSHFLNIEEVQSINDEAKRIIGIDILNHNVQLNHDSIEKYESFLDRVVDNNLSNKYSDLFLQDEIALLEKAKQFSITSFSSFKIGKINLIAKVAYKSIGLSVPSMVAHIKSAYNIQVLDNEQNHFLVASKIEVKSKSLIALFHISINKTAEFSRGDFKNIEQLAKNAKVDDDLAPHVSACFLFDINNSRLNSPVRMFLQAISKYGVDITIGNSTRKFFLSGFSSKLLINKGDELSMSSLKSAESSWVMSLKSTYTGYNYEFAYSVALNRMERDYKKGLFI